uniref:Ubiquitin carboxyl-terminal hydrolase n=1 Tax=Rhodosorus marinus TaxID=101924 RepID=A0A7S3EA70_9RHOD|mmetsp:Transcript_20812/g.84808  ORF Transcript_20812/g.84808 Transcript_20812/m.84808 type:complete len:326 (+) Transcript_20812:246-1223(+)|eukprot:CAMPEP_0113963244 /NCGR_PEP_ID=MMETSP0011_2-20120614/6397_1 /TAXON_ID=101924 /ORGANISM="Rhodosorus marinus" /LENGTH=325 /DNA_ID=CAMNT_0000975255 /DNA_START=77 /DNA_END=1054 /DNA_ORIENTATION=+ /assembly_acc=CAM_ASM_000156
MGDEGWCTIESDPGLFTGLLSDIGVKDVQVEELFSLDVESMNKLGEVFGVIFLFKWKVQDGNGDQILNGTLMDPSSVPIYFANQVINNACATQSILSIVLNSPELDIGTELSEFKEFTKDFDPTMKGLAISNLKTVRTAHNSNSPSQHFVLEGMKHAEKDDDIYHFVSYIPHDGSIYELDGTKAGPIKRGEAGDNWIEACIPVIQSRMNEYSVNEVRFNVMAVVRNRENMYLMEIAKLEEEKKTKGETEASEIAARIAELQADLEAEKVKRKIWKKENARRKHNYVPFVMELLKLLASKGELNKIIESAKAEKKKRMEASAKPES